MVEAPTKTRSSTGIVITVNLLISRLINFHACAAQVRAHGKPEELEELKELVEEEPEEPEELEELEEPGGERSPTIAGSPVDSGPFRLEHALFHDNEHHALVSRSGGDPYEWILYCERVHGWGIRRVRQVFNKTVEVHEGLGGGNWSFVEPSEQVCPPLATPHFLPLLLSIMTFSSRRARARDYDARLPAD